MYCSNCGVKFDTKDKRVRYCPECKEAGKNKTRACVICGVELSGKARKYCAKCGKAVKLSQIQKVMSSKHHIAIDKETYDKFRQYFKKSTEEIEKLMLARIEEICKH